MQIQEGQLLERGVINITNTRWMPVSDFTLQDRGIRENVDYHTMTWDKREIDFDDLKSPAGHVVTGVKFRLLGRHLNMEIRVTEIDFASGRLIEPDKSFWVSNDNTDISNGQARRTELALVGLFEIDVWSSLNQICFHFCRNYQTFQHDRNQNLFLYQRQTVTSNSLILTWEKMLPKLQFLS